MSRVLIIEDEVEIADLEKDYLELSGFEVEIENDGTVFQKQMSQALQRNKRAEENYIAGQVGICVVSARCCPQGDEGHKKEQAGSRMEDQN